MENIHTVVAAINISGFDDEALKRALLVAKENGAQLHIIYTIDISLVDIEISLDSFKKKIDEKDIKNKITQKLLSFKEDKNLVYFIHIVVGDAEEQIVHLAKKIRADLIIIGSKSKVKIEKYYFGSIENNIANKSSLPILVVKSSVKKSYQNILAPTDLSKPSKKAILFCKTVFKNSKMKLVFAYKDLDDLEIDYLNNSKDNALLGRPRINIFKEDVKIDTIKMLQCSTSIENELLNYILTTDADLLVVGSSGTDIAGSYFSSIANSLLRNSLLDILIYIPD